jgi:RNA-directed DNA polymerase
MASRLSRALNKIAEWCRKNRHLPVREQHKTLGRKLRGHCAYYGITGNSEALQKYRRGMRNLWLKWLRRRSRASRAKSWTWWGRFFERYELPPAIAMKSSLRHT